MADQEGGDQAMETDTVITKSCEGQDAASLKKADLQEDVIKENGVEDEPENPEPLSNGPNEVSNEAQENTDKPKETESEKMDSTDDTKTETVQENTEKDVEPQADQVQDSTPAEGQGADNSKTEVVSEEENGDESKDGSSVNETEAMDVDEDSNAVGSNSNISAPVSVDNDSKQASILSEDNSRDSLASAKTNSDVDTSQKNGFVGKVKDEEGTDILITLNENDKGGETDDSQEATSSADTTKTEPKAEVIEVEDSPVKSAAKPSSTPKSKADSTPTPNIVIPPNAKVVRQGDKVGYLTRIGNQNVLVPLSTSVSQASTPKSGKQHTPLPPLKPEDLKPKSSLDMIELMRWELYNRIPDNFNWSVAFHPKKEELSTITSFLLELGHDVVKEAVYKDIIQIQTKKKDNGDLKDNEIESLEKMKTVYDNTKKKVEHLFLDSKSCDKCKFKTESNVILDFHKDFPHFEPSWDTNKGVMKCSYCKFSTRVGLQFLFHMEKEHKVHAKFPEKDHTFNCELCPLSTSTRNKLEKHRQKCEKHFKLGSNLQPYFHDVNFCMKNMYYKPKKPPAPKPPPASQSASNTPKSGMTLRTPTAPSPASQKPAPTPQQTPTHVPKAIRSATPVVHPPVPRLQAPAKSPFQSQPPAKFRTAVPNMPNFPPKQSVPPNRGGRHTTNKEMQGFEVCELCGGYVKDRQALRIHFYYAHKVEMPQAIFTRPTPPLICDVCQSKFWTTQGLSKHKSTLRHFSSTGPTSAAFGTNQMCFMCMKKVPNLFSHVEQVHGMSMKDLVVMKKCIMCGVTANDKRSLESHLATAHGILMKATDLLGSNEKSPAPTRAQTRNSPQPQQQAPTPKSGGKSSNLARQNLCVFCQIQFADNIQLTMHCIKVHATCNGCGMVVASTKHLMYHSCKVMKRKCIICGLKNIAPEVYAVHVKSHVKPCNVQVDKLNSDDIEEVKKKIKKEYKPQVISLDSDEDSEVEIFDKDAKPNNSRSKGRKESNVTKNTSEQAKVESQDSKMTNGDIKPERSNGTVDETETETDLESKDLEEKVNETNSDSQGKDSEEKVDKMDVDNNEPEEKPQINESEMTGEKPQVNENEMAGEKPQVNENEMQVEGKDSEEEVNENDLKSEGKDLEEKIKENEIDVEGKDSDEGLNEKPNSDGKDLKEKVDENSELTESKDAIEDDNVPEVPIEDNIIAQNSDLVPLKPDDIDKTEQSDSLEDNSDTNGQEDTRKRKLEDQESCSSDTDIKRAKVDADSNSQSNLGATPDGDANIDV